MESAGDCCSALGACCDDIDPDENDECAVHGGIADAGVDANCKMSLDTLNALGECTGEDVEGACAELDQCCMHANAALACGAIENLQDLISAGDDAECAPTLSIVDLFCVDDPLF